MEYRKHLINLEVEFELNFLMLEESPEKSERIK